MLSKELKEALGMPDGVGLPSLAYQPAAPSLAYQHAD
jgi:hypothetical protein